MYLQDGSRRHLHPFLQTGFKSFQILSSRPLIHKVSDRCKRTVRYAFGTREEACSERCRIRHEATENYASQEHTTKNGQEIPNIHRHDRNHSMHASASSLPNKSAQNLQQIPHCSNGDIHGRRDNSLISPPWTMSR
jgi:hypothetical protein